MERYLDELFRLVIAHLLSRLLDRLLAPLPPVDHNLPAEQPRLIGRKKDLARLRGMLSPSSQDAVVVAIVGPGGVGKSALALAVAHEHLRRARSRKERLVDWLRRRLRRPPRGFFEAIVWVSAQEQRLDPSSPVPLLMALRDLPEVTAEITRTLGL